MSLVSENMEEFKRYQGSKPSLEIGIRVKIEKWLKDNNLTRYEILEDGTIDLQQNLNMQDGLFVNKPDYIDFESVQAYMDISNNRGLQILDGCPIDVNGYFYARNCDLESLEGGPEFVGGDFNVSGNKLHSLEGFPKEIKGWVSIGNNAEHFTEEEIREVSLVHGRIFTDISHLFDEIK